MPISPFHAMYKAKMLASLSFGKDIEAGEFVIPETQRPFVWKRSQVRDLKTRYIIVDGITKLLEHNDLRWITPDEIPQYDFCPADTQILKLIRDRI